MKSITNQEIEGLNITPSMCVEWVREAFLLKSECQLPAKMSVHPSGNDFFTTMPCLLPLSYGRFGAKVVSRIVGRVPALKSDMMLFDSRSGALEALVECDWITAMRTGAVAALAIKTLRCSTARDYAFIGLGSTARATLRCLLDICSDEVLHIRLFRYKNQAEKIIEEFGNVLPDYDRERVHVSDMKKCFAWYNILVKAGFTEFKLPETAEGEEAAEE